MGSQGTLKMGFKLRQDNDMLCCCFTYNITQALSGPVLSAVGERYYKVTAEALRVCGELVRVIRPSFEVKFVCNLQFFYLLYYY